MDNFKLYLIRCITNLHVGNGDSSYSIIDNQVQRDVITGFPVINSSSLKGSLRAYLKHNTNDDDILKKIFGHEELGVGKYKIFQGTLLSIPVRSNVKPFFRATCPRIIKEFKEFADSFNFNLESGLEKLIKLIDNNKNSSFSFDVEEKNDSDIKIEGLTCEIKKIEDKYIKKSEIEKLFGEDLLILDDDKFFEIIKELPIIARNKLENGESQNLWYEEIVPRESRFYFGVFEEKNCKYENIFKKITDEALQIGGNATIGYGFCDIEPIKAGDRR